MQPSSRRDDSTEPLTFEQRLSCLLDGERDALSAEDASLAWHERPDCRPTWHRWHLIGDVMRSGELASTPVRDDALLARVRERLAAEPVVLAPSLSIPKPARRARHVWLVPVAAAAGFAAVAVVVVAVRMQDGGTQPATLASGAAQPGVLPVASAIAPRGPAIASAAGDATMLRDADIDRYFLAHRKAISPAMPGGAPRNVDVMMQR
jgi:sigma-E factor negative regulatory protein RseA